MKKTGLKLNETSLVKFHETSEIISWIEKIMKLRIPVSNILQIENIVNLPSN